MTHGIENVVPLLRDIVRAAGGSIRGVLCAREIVEVKIEFAEEDGPACLAAIEDAGGHEILQIFVVANDGERDRSADRPGAEVAQRIDDSEEPFIVNFIVDFCGREFP